MKQKKISFSSFIFYLLITLTRSTQTFYDPSSYETIERQELIQRAGGKQAEEQKNAIKKMNDSNIRDLIKESGLSQLNISFLGNDKTGTSSSSLSAQQKQSNDAKIDQLLNSIEEQAQENKLVGTQTLVNEFLRLLAKNPTLPELIFSNEKYSRELCRSLFERTIIKTDNRGKTTLSYEKTMTPLEAQKRSEAVKLYTEAIEIYALYFTDEKKQDYIKFFWERIDLADQRMPNTFKKAAAVSIFLTESGQKMTPEDYKAFAAGALNLDQLNELCKVAGDNFHAWEKRPIVKKMIETIVNKAKQGDTKELEQLQKTLQENPEVLDSLNLNEQQKASLQRQDNSSFFDITFDQSVEGEPVTFSASEKTPTPDSAEEEKTANFFEKICSDIIQKRTQGTYEEKLFDYFIDTALAQDKTLSEYINAEQTRIDQIEKAIFGKKIFTNDNNPIKQYLISRIEYSNYLEKRSPVRITNFWTALEAAQKGISKLFDGKTGRFVRNLTGNLTPSDYLEFARKAKTIEQLSAWCNKAGSNLPKSDKALIVKSMLNRLLSNPTEKAKLKEQFKKNPQLFDALELSPTQKGSLKAVETSLARTSPISDPVASHDPSSRQKAEPDKAKGDAVEKKRINKSK